jgi:hydrogenase nickel incorporation protein HypA/HybF
VYHIVEKVQKVMADNALTEVEAIVLQVGEKSAVVPKYLHECYPAAVDGTALANTVLEIEISGGDSFLIKELRAR